MKIYTTDGHFSKRLGNKTPNMVHFTIIITFLDGAFLIFYEKQQQIESFNDFNISVINALMIL